jgi:hypothetical protein
MFRLSHLLLAAVLVAGCATPADMRARKPDFEAHSNRSAKEIAICVADRWENSGPFGGSIPVTLRPTETGFTVSWRNEVLGHTGMLVDIDEVSSGTRTRFFKSAVLGEEKYLVAVQECQSRKS